MWTGDSFMPKALRNSSTTIARYWSGSVCSFCRIELNWNSLAFFVLNSRMASLSPFAGILKLTPSISTSGRKGTMTSPDIFPNLDSISATNSLRTEGGSSSMFILNPRFRDWIMDPPLTRMKLPKTSFTSMTRENTSTFVSEAEVITDFE